MSPNQVKYKLRDGTVLSLQNSTLHLSYGTWNYRTLSVEFKPELNEVMKRLTTELIKDGVSIQELKEEYELNYSDVLELEDLFKQMQSNGFIYSSDFLNQAIGGSFLLLGFNEIQTSEFRARGESRPRVAILRTISTLEYNSTLLEAKKWLDITEIDLNSIPNLSRFDSTSGTNAVDLIQFFETHKSLAEYDTVVVILAHLNPLLLRNLNRIFMHYGVSWMLATVDGPFVLMTSFVPELTGCFECLELRIISQMRSMEEYKSFVHLLLERSSSMKKYEFTPILQIPIAIAINELLLMAGFGANHFVGRLLSIYMPFFEIQFHDLLRLPICPACGHTSKATMKELYFDFRKFVGDITDKLK